MQCATDNHLMKEFHVEKIAYRNLANELRSKGYRVNLKEVPRLELSWAIPEKIIASDDGGLFNLL